MKALPIAGRGRNHRGVLAIKLVAPLGWMVFTFVLIYVLVLNVNLQEKISEKLDATIDRYSYLLALELNTGRGNNTYLHRLLADVTSLSHISRIEVYVGKELYSKGKASAEYQKIERPLFLKQAEKAKVVYFLLPEQELVKQERLDILLTIGVPTFLFMSLLVWLVNIVIAKPVARMVQVTQRINKGEQWLRMQENRDDELGQLAQFFNSLINGLQSTQDGLRIALENAKSASNAKSSFLANMSHELRTPLNAIIGYSEMIRDAVRDTKNEDTLRDLDNVLHASQHLLGLINDILDLSKIEAGRMELSMTTIKIKEFFTGIIDSIRPLANKNHNQFMIDINSDLTEMFSDDVKLKQVMYNLLSNACKFTEAGVIKFTALSTVRNRVNGILIYVSDTGIGMTEQQQETIFQDFVQADVSTTRKYGGTGLGLSISKHYVEMLGGEIYVNSRLGEGTTFEVFFPLNSGFCEIDYNKIAQSG